MIESRNDANDFIPDGCGREIASSRLEDQDAPACGAIDPVDGGSFLLGCQTLFPGDGAVLPNMALRREDLCDATRLNSLRECHSFEGKLLVELEHPATTAVQQIRKRFS